jgi:hypothetical protein
MCSAVWPICGLGDCNQSCSLQELHSHRNCKFHYSDGLMPFTGTWLQLATGTPLATRRSITCGIASLESQALISGTLESTELGKVMLAERKSHHALICWTTQSRLGDPYGHPMMWTNWQVSGMNHCYRASQLTALPALCCPAQRPAAPLSGV